MIAVGIVLAFRAVLLPAQTTSETPGELVRKTVQNELKASTEPTSFMFRARKETPHGSQTKLYVQTRDATAGMLIAVNDQPLTPQQRTTEEGHLRYLLNNPDELKRKQKQEREDADRIGRIMRALPDAFLYEYDGTEKGTPQIGRAGKDLVRLRFQRNPDYNPPSRVEQVLTGMKGYLLIDRDQCRIAKIDGSLYRDVSFGWGFFGHLDKGSQFQVEQGEVADSHWDVKRMRLSFTGKILLFKSLVIKSTEVYSDFRRVPSDLTFAQGVELLEKEVSSGGENHSAEN